MSPSRLTARVTAHACALLIALAAPAAWLGGARAGLGVLAGGALGLLNFRWLAARAVAATAGAASAGGAWSVGAGLRLAALAVACGALLGLEWAHPVALLAGLGVLPCAVIAVGLCGAGEEP